LEKAVSAFGGKDEIAAVLLVDALQESHRRAADRADGFPGLAIVEFHKTLFEVHLWPGQAGNLVPTAAREGPEAGNIQRLWYSLSEREREIAVCIINSKWHSAYPTSAHERRGKEVGLPARKVGP
jgi:hypothetical protein